MKNVHFGYNPPSGARGLEQFPRATFVRDLHNALDVASRSFSSFWVSDHLMTADPFRMECWTQLTWMAARYPSQMLGTIVLANSFRHPPLLAKMAATLQAFSGGRLILGYGAGWVEEEYRAYGYDFPRHGARIEQMVEAVRLMRAMWSDAPASFEGRSYQIRDAFCEPRPDPPPIVMIGGDGERRLLPAVAEHANWWNTLMRPVPVLRHKINVLHGHCNSIGRDPATVRKTLTRVAYLAPTRGEAEQRAAHRLQEDVPPFAGEPAALVDHLNELVELGFDAFQLVFPGFPDTADLRLFADKVLPSFA